MTTWTALTTLPGQGPAEALAARLEDLDPAPAAIGAFEIEDGSGLWEVGAHFTGPPDDVALALLAAAGGAKPFAISEVPETDWVAAVRRDLAPVEAGRFYLYGAHDADTVPADREGLLIEASMAFGTGHHGTTRGCLEALDRLQIEGGQPSSVIDLGCGTAVLAMAAARLWPEARVIGSDIDPVAIDVARVNVSANDLAGRVDLVIADGLEHPALRRHMPADLICANILKGPLIDLAPSILAALASPSWLVLSGLLVDQAAEVIDVYGGLDLLLHARIDHGDWATLTFRRADPTVV